MLQSIKLSNFQSHKDTLLEFSSGVNVVVGPSDSGKTAVLRALNWIVNNRPLGDSFRLHNSSRTKVAVAIGNTQVIRIRSDKDNFYKVDGMKLEAFGQDVPDTVRVALGFGELNIQGQLDPPFLLSSSPGEVAQILNRCVKLDVIDSSLSNITRRSRGVNDEIKTEEARGKELEEKLKEYEYLDEAEMLVGEAEGIEKRAQESTRETDNLYSLIREIKDLGQRASIVDRVLKAEREIGKVQADLQSLDDRNREMTFLKEGVKVIRGLEASFSKVETLLKCSPFLQEAEAMASWLTSMLHEEQGLDGLLMEYTRLSESKIGYEETISSTEQVYSKRMPDICPLCGQFVKKGRV